MHGGTMSKQIKMTLRNFKTDEKLAVYIDLYQNSLSEKWLSSLDNLLNNNYHLEKNYCFFGFADGDRNGELILKQVNQSISAINQAGIGYQIDDNFTIHNTLEPGDIGFNQPGGKLIQEKFNQLHRYFEDLQGVSGQLSPYYQNADSTVRWHIRQLNLLCHEFESWALSYRKAAYLPEWQRPSQLMCWLHAPRFELDHDDYELFGIDTLIRSLGGVYVGVNKAVGKHHFEVFQDEGKHSKLTELTTTTLRSQTEATGDFDIEWANNPGNFEWKKQQLHEFRSWLIDNGFDPDDKALTIGHPKVAQVNLMKSFGTEDYQIIWGTLYKYLDVYSIETPSSSAVFDYHWSDHDFVERQIKIIQQGKAHEMVTQYNQPN
jgi:hypothetical protein